MGWASSAQNAQDHGKGGREEEEEVLVGWWLPYNHVEELSVGCTLETCPIRFLQIVRGS